MIELLHQIEQIDTQIFLFFNGFHNEYWDYFMMISQTVLYGFRSMPVLSLYC